jgi:hypothetical protein
VTLAYQIERRQETGDRRRETEDGIWFLKACLGRDSMCNTSPKGLNNGTGQCKEKLPVQQQNVVTLAASD